MLGIAKFNVVKITRNTVNVTQGKGRFNNYQALAAIWGFIADQPVPIDGPNPTTLLTFESEAEIIVGQPLTIVRMRGRAGTNTFVNPFDIKLRINGVTVSTLSIPAGSTALIDSGVLAIPVAVGDRLAYLYNSAAGAGGVDDLKIELEYDGTT